jgi:hypothetical protein
MGIQSKIPACGIIIVCEADQLKTVKSACQLFNAAIEIITENQRLSFPSCASRNPLYLSDATINLRAVSGTDFNGGNKSLVVGIS